MDALKSGQWRDCRTEKFPSLRQWYDDPVTRGGQACVRQRPVFAPRSPRGKSHSRINRATASRFLNAVPNPRHNKFLKPNVSTNSANSRINRTTASRFLDAVPNPRHNIFSSPMYQQIVPIAPPQALRSMSPRRRSTASPMYAGSLTASSDFWHALQPSCISK